MNLFKAYQNSSLRRNMCVKRVKRVNKLENLLIWKIVFQLQNPLSFCTWIFLVLLGLWALEEICMLLWL